jgi:acetyltransferase
MEPVGATPGPATKLGVSRPGATKPGTDPAHDVLRTEGFSLDAVFNPKCVAVIGASERPGSVGRRVFWALLSSPFGGTVFLVNKDRTSVLGIKTCPSVKAVPEPVDLAIIVTPAATVPDIISECVEPGVRARHHHLGGIP